VLSRLIGLIVAVGLLLSIAPPADANPDTVAHQGYAGSYSSATRSGATLEGDIQWTKDNKPVISHDARLHRKCKGKTLIKKLKWNQIRKCDRSIIRLETLVAIGKANHVDISIEFKNNGGKKWTRGKMKKVYRILARGGMLRGTEVYSFKPYLISKWRGVDKRHDTKTGLNVNTRSGLNPAAIKRAGGRVAVRMDLVNADKVKWLQNQGIYVAIYTVRSDAQLARVRAMKPDAIITDIRI
jgi:glycerophosphoryl diester phosphodiesterase